MPTATPIAATEDELAAVAFDDNGLVPAIIQEDGTGRVLMLAWMDAEALRRTLDEGRTWFWSRSRKEHWRKGDTSGDRQWVRAAYYDCDMDTLLFVVEQEGRGACHTGERTCFFRGETDPVPAEALATLERTIASRRAASDGVEGSAAGGERPSYTRELLGDPPRIGAKVREEADEVVRAAAEESDARVREEAADVLYHLAVLLAARDLSLADAFAELNARRR
jgi:phosphoribosyl-AMP cyclohydrolase / phosphoribosyl-ATP pyrophosphohydrolase